MLGGIWTGQSVATSARQTMIAVVDRFELFTEVFETSRHSLARYEREEKDNVNEPVHPRGETHMRCSASPGTRVPALELPHWRKSSRRVCSARTPQLQVGLLTKQNPNNHGVSLRPMLQTPLSFISHGAERAGGRERV